MLERFAHPISSVDFRTHDVSMIRADTRAFASSVGLDAMQQARFSTALSEIVRNAVQHAGGGSVDFFVGASPDPTRQCVIAVVRDQGPGIADIRSVLQGAARSDGRPAMGIQGAQRLTDRLTVESPEGGGTSVRLEIDLPRGSRRLDAEELDRIRTTLAGQKARSPYELLAEQNRELMAVHQELRHKQTALEMADERKNQFVTTLAHELRNPLATIEMTTLILRRSRDLGHDEVVRRAEIISRQVGQMARLVDDLVDVARISQGKVDLVLEVVDINQVVRRAIETSGAVVAGKSHDLSTQLQAEPIWVVADASRMEQVFSNLIQNAARYTPPGGSIQISSRADAESAIVDVVDSGIGIPGDLLPHIFDLFVQGAPDRVKEGGLGIGLTLVHRLVTEHQGQVEVRSLGAGHGSQFTVILPRIGAAPEPSQ
ncbi:MULTISPECIES: ATP-binding protein [Ramlibacter]|uniref:histidine kinase n=1 Tax=Ramlibacter pinisoli TaxID=2682844 RepID=A0A6N8IMJ1_9BURK|nr:sensor histidine kinase [Ramlibacter sp. CGMCC 1.13660]MVQ28067.1 ATPase [Ramlibacter pinisoli]